MSGPVRFVIAAIVALVCAGGCAVPYSASGYFENRRQDLIDVLHVDLGLINVGAVAYVGPLMVGLDYQTGVTSRSQADTIQIGLGGPRILGHKGLAAGLLLPASKWDEDKPLIGPRPKRAPSGTSVGASSGVFLGLGAEADVLELIDFVLGLACLDLTDDDEDTMGAGEAAKEVTVGTAKAATEVALALSPTRILLAGKAATIDQLPKLLADAAQASPGAAVRIAVAAGTTQGQVAQVLEACRQAGLTKVIITAVAAP